MTLYIHNCSFDIEIEFEANPKPDVTWEMQVEKGRNGETVKEGKSRGNYEALDIEEDVSAISKRDKCYFNNVLFRIMIFF